jgi:hypothetical protein
MRMFRLSMIALFAAALSAQDPGELFHKPPEDVDQALRARVTEFFELHVKGDFRRAEALVAEDTKDFFYNGNKPRYLSFEITQIKYNEDFTRAHVMVMCEQHIHMPGFDGKPMKVPTPSDWKLEDGKWCWYVDQEQLHNTPFGRMWVGSSPAAGSAAPPTSIPTLQQFYGMFKADKDSVDLPAGGIEKVTISNGSPGSMTVQLLGSLTGIEAKFDQTQVKAGERAVLTLHASEKAKSGTLQLRIDPVGKIIAIRVSVK